MTAATAHKTQSSSIRTSTCCLNPSVRMGHERVPVTLGMQAHGVLILSHVHVLMHAALEKLGYTAAQSWPRTLMGTVASTDHPADLVECVSEALVVIECPADGVLILVTHLKQRLNILHWVLSLQQ
eukprot:GHUV01023073.1.p2 GENE.GHUV01023073.1~~GHUV01023073.1.p2  ORF type:complete len:126 (+),score=21.79 GHUV01023073.1:771-1148(+)